nr:unnamed protein product [Digitaria exilis]
MDETSTAMAASPFPTVDKCSSTDRASDTVVADLDGTLLCGRSSFPYFAHMAFETGGVLRLLLLIVLAPLAGLLYYFVSEPAGIQVLIFASMAGAKISDIEAVARAVLPKFYCSDLHPESWRVFSECGRRCVLTANPRIMVEAFLKEYIGTDVVVGTELAVWRGRATGLVRSPGVLVGEQKADALRRTFGDMSPDVGLGDRRTDYPFMRLCKEGYVVPATPKVKPVAREDLPKPVVFHDGRLVQKPSPAMALLTVLWIPIGFLLACLRIAAGALLPMRMVYHAFRALGVRVTIKGNPPPPASRETGQTGVLFICSHRTLLDPIFLSTALGRPITAVTYSVRGWKGLDPFYFFMNPSPGYVVTFLNKLPGELTCSGGKSSHEVANYIQRIIASTLSYECTSFTRKDKYKALAGNDGSVVSKPNIDKKKVMGC